MNRFLTIVLLLIVCGRPASAQFQGNIYTEDSVIRAFAYGHQNGLAWCGGFTNPQFAKGDLNHDGRPDLVIFENGIETIRTFINTSTVSGQPNYVYMPQYAKNFPACRNFLKLEDYNRDGIPDLIEHGSVDGFALHKGYYNAQSQLCFTFYKSLRYLPPGATADNNAYSAYIPGVADADGDGDLDFFSYDVTGGIIYFYKNCQVEHGLPKDSVQICLPTICWGHMTQGNNRAFTFGTSNSQFPCNQVPLFGCKGTAHGGNNTLMFDYDGDGDLDMLDGNQSYNDMQFTRNGRIPNGNLSDSMASQDTLWQSGGHMINMATFPAAFFVDANADGKNDILISPMSNTGAENYKCIALYANTGTAAAPQFSYQGDTFLVDHSIDLGSASYPLLYDYNKDGRLDLIVGSDGYYQPNGTYRSKVSYYQNTLVNGVTQMVLQTTDLAGAFAENFYGAAPAVGDLDSDGKDDLLLGHNDGTISFYKNMAASNTVPPVWQLTQLHLKATTGDSIHVGKYAAPFIYDLNKDGKPDLLVGNENGQVFYYKNTSNGSGPSLLFSTNSLGLMTADPVNVFGGHSTLYVGKVDASGKDYILMGNSAGVIRRYDGFQSGNVNMVYQLIDSMYSNIQTDGRSAVAVGDIDGDGKYNMLIGNTHGGLLQYRQALPGAVHDGGLFSASAHCSLYPNPASNVVYLAWDEGFAGRGDQIYLHVLNLAGQTVWEGTINGADGNATISISSLPAGVYMAMAHAGDRKFAARFTVLR